MPCNISQKDSQASKDLLKEKEEAFIEASEKFEKALSGKDKTIEQLSLALNDQNAVVIDL